MLIRRIKNSTGRLPKRRPNAASPMSAGVVDLGEFGGEQAQPANSSAQLRPPHIVPPHAPAKVAVPCLSQCSQSRCRMAAE